MTLEEKAQKYTIDNVCGNCNKCQSKGYIGCDKFRFAKKAYIDGHNDGADEFEPIEKVDCKYYNGDYCPRNLIGYQFKWVRYIYTDEVGYCVSVDSLGMSLKVIFPTRTIFVYYKHLICIDEHNKKYKKQINQVNELPLM